MKVFIWPNFTLGVLNFTLGVLNFSLGVLNFTLGVLNFTLGVLNFSLGVLNFSLGVLNFTPGGGVLHPQGTKIWDGGSSLMRSFNPIATASLKQEKLGPYRSAALERKETVERRSDMTQNY